MITKIADNIISPLGMSVDETLHAIIEGKSEIKPHEGAFGLPEPFCASLFNREEIGKCFLKEIGDSEHFSFFEQLCILSASRAIRESGIDAGESDVIFILSTTKGNVDALEGNIDDESAFIGTTALKITEFFGNPNVPIVASNACISGVCAQIAGVRALLSSKYRHAVVIGCDVLSKFIISGFQSFKALSSENCRPFDRSRCGLNLGEAVATLILSSKPVNDSDDWKFLSCSVHNDANHISGPSRTGEGLYRVMTDILNDVDCDEVAFVNVHGTATNYNDEMESIALHRAGLDELSVNGLKGFLGHTLGAAGIIETILSMKACEKGIVLPTRGYEECGTSYALNISSSVRPTDKKTFIKVLSGFGGTNAGIAYRKGESK